MAGRFCVVLLLLLLSVTPSWAHRYYVDIEASGFNTGESWVNAFNSLRSALDIANTNDEIWVAQGKYTPATVPDETNRALSFVVPSAVRLYGGFQGGETGLSQRDYKTYPTILSGQMSASAVSYHVVRFSNVNALTRLDGFTVTHGYADGGFANSYGGGIYNTASGAGQSSNPYIARCVIQGNHANQEGAGVYNFGSSSGMANPLFYDCLITDNENAVRGGGFYNQSSEGATANPTINLCTFSENVADGSEGGALCNIASGVASPSISKCTFYQNFSDGAGAGIYNSSWGGTANPSVTDCSFRKNYASASGGALFNSGSSATGTANPSFTRCSFRGNSAYRGGGLANRASTEGTASPTFENCLFSGNAVYAAAGGYCGGAIHNQTWDSGSTANPEFLNCTFTANISKENRGGAICVYADGGSQANLKFTNCIIHNNKDNLGTDNASASIYLNSGSAQFYYSLVENCGSSGEEWNATCGIDQGANIDSDPLFRNPIQTLSTRTDSGNFHLTSRSPPKDAGICGYIDFTYPFGPKFFRIAPEDDLDGHDRCPGLHTLHCCDMGAYEYFPISLNGALFLLLD